MNPHVSRTSRVHSDLPVRTAIIVIMFLVALVVIITVTAQPHNPPMPSTPAPIAVRDSGDAAPLYASVPLDAIAAGARVWIVGEDYDLATGQRVYIVTDADGQVATAHESQLEGDTRAAAVE